MTMVEDEDECTFVTIDEMLLIIGPFGRYQKLVSSLLFVMTLPPVYHVMILFFAAETPKWRCVANSTTCPFNETLDGSDQRRCHVARSQWEYTSPKHVSMVTYFEIDCHSRWLLELATSIFFLTWLIGAIVLGWCCDAYGRRRVLLFSTTAVMVTGLLCTIAPSFIFIVVCRFIIGFFLPGTLHQSFIIVTELVGNTHRATAGLLIFLASSLSLAILGVKAYFIRHWKMLHIACTAPYLILVCFFRYIPESVRYLRVKGRMEELLECFRRMARCNGLTIPSSVLIMPPSKRACAKPTNPVALFRGTRQCVQTTIQAIVYYTNGLAYYGLYLAAKDLSGSKYRDYIILSATEIPITIVVMDFCERFGRRKTTVLPMMGAAFSLLALAFIHRGGEKRNMGRVVLGVIGKCLIGSCMNTVCTWTTELYPTHVRGQAMGFLQAFMRLGAATAPWLDKELVRINSSASFLFMASFSFISFILLSFLPETKGTVELEEEEVEEGDDVSTLKLVIDSMDAHTVIRRRSLVRPSVSDVGPRTRLKTNSFLV